MQNKGTLIVTADHGNAEILKDPKTGLIKTSHTTSPVPFIFINQKNKNCDFSKLEKLSDICSFVITYHFLD